MNLLRQPTSSIHKPGAVAWARFDNTHKGGPMSVTRFPNAIYDPSHPGYYNLREIGWK